MASLAGFDISYAYDPHGAWTRRHQMSLNGKREGFDRQDLIALAKLAGIKKARASEMVERVVVTVRRWPEFASRAGVADGRVAMIQATQRTDL